MAGFECRIYYAGFNGHLKLGTKNENDPTLLFCPLSNENCVRSNIGAFTAVHHPSHQTSILLNTWSATLLRCDNDVWHVGYTPSRETPALVKCAIAEGIDVDDLKVVFGDPVGGILGLVTARRRLLISIEYSNEGPVFKSLSPRTKDPSVEVDGAAISGNGQLYIGYSVEIDGVESSLLDIMKCDNGVLEDEVKTLACPERISIVAAGSTAVVVLTAEGRVFTSGSPLQASLLARTPTSEHPANELGPVNALGGIAIAKICMCEWLAGALSVDRDLYTWGGRTGDEVRIECLPTDGEDVKLVDIADSVDVVDFAIGMGHILVLTSQGEVWGCGENEFGQLGMCPGNLAFVPDWVKIPTSWTGEEVEGLVVGGYGSWVITRRALND